MLARFVERLCARWRRDLLRLALGIWKISLIEAESARRRPLYARRAAVQLMASWFSGLRARNLRVWVDRWRSGVARELCLERDLTVLPIQSAFRSPPSPPTLTRLTLPLVQAQPGLQEVRGAAPCGALQRSALRCVSRPG